VHKELGHGFLEPVYQEALAIEFASRKIPYEREKEINIFFKGIQLSKTYKSDFICFEKIIVELKALSQLTNEHDAQILNYLKETQLKLGLLFNFGQKSLKHKRFVL
jgi:GxxExxY protein